MAKGTVNRPDAAALNGLLAREQLNVAGVIVRLAWQQGLTREEIALGFGRFPRMGGELNCEAFPGEEDVLDLAAAWGIDPRFTPGAYPPGTGWVCTLA